MSLLANYLSLGGHRKIYTKVSFAEFFYFVFAAWLLGAKVIRRHAKNNQTLIDQGLVVLGVPSNDFGSQEPGSENKIKKFCETNFSINFPMTAKAKVIGKKAHPFFIWARAQVGVVGSPKWNFHKYLIGPDGQLLDWFASSTKPNSIKVKKAIEKALH